MRAEIGHVRVMSRFVLVSVALSVASAQRGGRPAPAKSAEMCWEMKHGYNAVKGMLKAPRTERSIAAAREAEPWYTCGYCGESKPSTSAGGAVQLPLRRSRPRCPDHKGAGLPER